ncbi:MAG: TetR/AcrR family transcriptional regulator [Acidobacteriota bacterium]
MARPVTKRSDIEQAAMRLFARRGLTGITIKDIAAEAGCAEGALYRHYAGKEDLAWQLFQREVEAFGRRIREVWDSPESSLKRLERGIELFYRFFDEEPELFAFILLSQHHFPPDKKLKKNLSPVALVFEFVENASKGGALRIEDPKLGAAMLLGIVLQPATFVAEKKLKGPLVQYAPAVTKAAVRLLRG